MNKNIVFTYALMINVILLGIGVGFTISILKELAFGDNNELTADVYVDTVINQNVNLVFYKTGCPYCRAGKKAVVTAAKESSYPTFYVDVDSDKGQQLVKQYQVEKAATIITVRDGESHFYVYAKKTSDGDIKKNQKNIKEAFHD